MEDVRVRVHSLFQEVLDRRKNIEQAALKLFQDDSRAFREGLLSVLYQLLEHKAKTYVDRGLKAMVKVIDALLKSDLDHSGEPGQQSTKVLNKLWSKVENIACSGKKVPRQAALMLMDLLLSIAEDVVLKHFPNSLARVVAASLYHRDHEVRTATLPLVVKAGNWTLLKKTFECDPSNAVKVAALKQLELNETTAPFLVHVLEDPHKEVRRKALERVQDLSFDLFSPALVRKLLIEACEESADSLCIAALNSLIAKIKQEYAENEDVGPLVLKVICYKADIAGELGEPLPVYMESHLLKALRWVATQQIRPRELLQWLRDTAPELEKNPNKLGVDDLLAMRIAAEVLEDRKEAQLSSEMLTVEQGKQALCELLTMPHTLKLQNLMLFIGCIDVSDEFTRHELFKLFEWLLQEIQPGPPLRKWDMIESDYFRIANKHFCAKSYQELVAVAVRILKRISLEQFPYAAERLITALREDVETQQTLLDRVIIKHEVLSAELEHIDSSDELQRETRIIGQDELCQVQVNRRQAQELLKQAFRRYAVCVCELLKLLPRPTTEVVCGGQVIDDLKNLCDSQDLVVRLAAFEALAVASVCSADVYETFYSRLVQALQSDTVTESKYVAAKALIEGMMTHDHGINAKSCGFLVDLLRTEESVLVALAVEGLGKFLMFDCMVNDAAAILSVLLVAKLDWFKHSRTPDLAVQVLDVFFETYPQVSDQHLRLLCEGFLVSLLIILKVHDMNYPGEQFVHSERIASFFEAVLKHLSNKELTDRQGTRFKLHFFIFAFLCERARQSRESSQMVEIKRTRREQFFVFLNKLDIEGFSEAEKRQALVMLQNAREPLKDPRIRKAVDKIEAFLNTAEAAPPLGIDFKPEFDQLYRAVHWAFERFESYFNDYRMKGERKGKDHHSFTKRSQPEFRSEPALLKKVKTQDDA